MMALLLVLAQDQPTLVGVMLLLFLWTLLIVGAGALGWLP